MNKSKFSAITYPSNIVEHFLKNPEGLSNFPMPCKVLVVRWQKTANTGNIQQRSQRDCVFFLSYKADNFSLFFQILTENSPSHSVFICGRKQNLRCLDHNLLFARKNMHNKNK
ncbi:hypothetical protein NE237_001864 [Protea cynaroides]|uniref:Uncharacterized protein n=1 Tax=Protea cynaroides TaxID=273540 RepID=A0A9Q0KTW9_9MAGN|nr:hypothetical protein NE237_001864 [Protea cynaroides]